MFQEYLHKYSNEQAMTLSELSLMKKLYEFSQMKNQTHGHNVYKICIDVSGWCSMFRSDTVHPVAREKIDKIYGTNLAGRTHDSYEHARVYIPDELLPAAWDGQLGGIEGLNQHTWVIIYLAQLKYAFRDLGARYHLLCKGMTSEFF